MFAHSTDVLIYVAIFLACSVSSSGQDGMTFRCEDLRSAGLVLVPAISPDYDALLADIQNRIDHPPADPQIMLPPLRKMMFGKISPEKRPTSAILLNRSDKSIAALALVWRYEEAGGRTYTRSFMNTFGNALLLPFSNQGPLSEKAKAYWFTILPGSKRYLGENEMAGDNTDVRLPGPDEIWTGGGGFGAGGGSGRQMPDIRSVTLAIDGVFFTDGEFIGPNQLGLWENVTAEAKTRMAVAKSARDGKGRGLSAAAILAEIIAITGPAPHRPPAPPPGPVSSDDASARSLQRAQSMFSQEIQTVRRMGGDDRAVDVLASQADARLPDYRRK
jgi:hypothetical protein